MDAALEAIKLCKVYKRPERTIEVLKGVNLKVPDGKFVALSGQSGCGKTTLLHLLGALDKPTAGEIICFGQSVTEMGVFRQARFRLAEIGFVFQSYQLMPELSALENIMLAGQLGNLSGKESRERARHLLAQVGMSDRAEHRPAELSGGEQQRIAIARSLMNRPRIILADEPTGNLDPKNSRGILELLQELRQQEKKTILMVTHNRELTKAADITYVLENGVLHR